MDLSIVESTILDSTYKGYPYNAAALPISKIPDQGWDALRDLPLPLALIKRSALNHNIRWLSDFTKAHGIALCPHGKTTMCPQIFKRQLDEGSWGITLASMHQVHVAVQCGVKTVLLANELVGSNETQLAIKLLAANPQLEIYSLIDSQQQLEQLEQQAQLSAAKRPLKVLLEVGIPGGRTGVRSTADAVKLAVAIHGSQHVVLAGIECYEGLKVTGDSISDSKEVSMILNQVMDVANQCDQQQLFDSQAAHIIISAGGSAVIDLVVHDLAHASFTGSRPLLPVLRSGCYVTHDMGTYERFNGKTMERLGDAWTQKLGGTLQPALEVWAQVLSLPEQGLAILGIGRRDASTDKDLPKPFAHITLHDRTTQQGSNRHFHSIPTNACTVTKLMDQHAYMQYNPIILPLAVGDILGCGISHPCTTFDKWQWIPLVDDEYQVVEAIKTYF